MTLKNKRDAKNPWQTQNNDKKPDLAGFAVMSVQLQPGLPKVTEMQGNTMSPPAHIPPRQAPPKKPSPSHHNNKNKRNMHKKEETPKKSPQNANTMHLLPFQTVSPLPFAANSVPIHGIKNENGTVMYPLLLCSQEGTLMISMAAGVIVEICVDRSFRVVCNSDLTAYVSANGSVTSVLHKYAKVVHGREHVHCKFSNTNDRMAVLGPEGILFSMDSLSEAYLLSSLNENGPSATALEKPTFPIQNMDYSIQQMYAESDLGVSNLKKCESMMQNAMYERKPDGTIIVHINGMHLKSNADTGEVTVEAKPVRLTVNSVTLSVQLRSSHIDMAIQDKDKCYVKRGDKRIHTSRSGMVVSDGTCTISMDQYGRILSCS